MLITGDFNIHHINWQYGSTSGTCTRDEKLQAESLINLIEDNYLWQHITEPTRGNNTLDLIISHDPLLIHSYETEDTVMSDHKLILARTTLGNSFKSNAIREMRKYSNELSEQSRGEHGHHLDAEMQAHMRLFRAQRNFYISGFSLFL
ncbi:hypothetical protein Pcinc_012449 [Petrolisthes cinctipes]|uniref:Endonuclease/exonuclease/phosphatase domain-containing protein n=1 Tax=Petrolisthes cinctipes TaxID=88211 RepID=A0AAE1KTK3_PETCI|nr:hypothetical protein Pcinc_012449 [Petrolisthes cinctipes]